MKEWSVKKIDLWRLREELEAYSAQGWIIYQIDYLGIFGTEYLYSIIATKETSNADNR